MLIGLRISSQASAHAAEDRRATGSGWSDLQGPLLLAPLFLAWIWLQGDLWVADRLYALEGHAWTLRHAWLTQEAIHLLGRHLSTAAWLAVLAAWRVARLRPSRQHLRAPLLYLLLATASSTLLVAWIKSWSNVDCPWDLARYGGTRAYAGLFGPRAADTRGVCFPAGHASAGYAWLALYYFLRWVRPQWRVAGLVVGFGAGLLFGIAQQLRGAHFLSHDIAAATICWICAVVLYRIARARNAPSGSGPAP